MGMQATANGHAKRPGARLGERVRIDVEFAGLIPALGRHEHALLEENIVAVGCQVALVVWSGEKILLDGHNRFEICRRHHLPFTVRLVALPDREAARNFVVATQLGRRNLSAEGASYLRGLRYLAEKLPNGGDRRKQAHGHHDHLKSAERLALEFGVSEATLRRDGRFAGAVEAIDGNCGGVKKAMLARDSGLRRGAVLRIAGMSPSGQREAIGVWRETGRLPRGSAVKTITLPAEPRAFAAKLVRTLGAERSREYLAAVNRVLGCYEGES